MQPPAPSRGRRWHPGVPNHQWQSPRPGSTDTPLSLLAGAGPATVHGDNLWFLSPSGVFIRAAITITLFVSQSTLS
jgi:hypothetical protein